MSKRSIGISCALVLILATSVAGFARWRNAVTARKLVSIANSLSDPQLKYDADLMKKLHIPPALHTRELAVVHYLLKALDLDSGRSSGAYYSLGRYLLNKDCSAALFYLEAHCRTHSCDAATLGAIDQIRRSGCGGLVTGRGGDSSGDQGARPLDGGER